MDIESAETVHALEFFETVERHFARTGDELKQLRTLFLIVRAHRTPEPLNLRRCGRIVVVFSIALPVIDVNFGKTRDQKLELVLIEDCNQFCRDDLMKT